MSRLYQDDPDTDTPTFPFYVAAIICFLCCFIWSGWFFIGVLIFTYLGIRRDFKDTKEHDEY